MDKISSISIDSEGRNPLTSANSSLFHSSNQARTEGTIHHPVEGIQQHYHQQQERLRDQQLANIYGSTAMIRNRLEQRMLSTVGRLPLHYGTSQQSSHLGLQILQGTDEDIHMGDYMNLPENNPEIRLPDPHQQMEKLLGDKPYKRFS